jgi:ribosome-associated protein
MSAGPLRIQPGLLIPETELTESYSRAGGPGGQHVNKVATRATLRWDIASSAVLRQTQRSRLLDKLSSRLSGEGVLSVHVSSSRSQSANRQEARERLAELVRAALVVQRKRRATRPTRASRERRLNEKKRKGERKRGRQRLRED